MIVVLNFLLILLVRIFSIAVSTIRILIMGRSPDWLVGSLSFVEALTFALTFGAVAQDLTNIPNLLAYCLGFALGTIIGTIVDERIAQGYATVNIVSRGHSLPIAEHIRKAGFGATRSPGQGASGAQGIVWAVARRRDVRRIVEITERLDPKAFVTVVETRAVRHGFISYGRH
ncbi:MAG: DUF2179 domain-containing protein [Chloroflexi bacterium]|nr:DUF2179 domain-containing protein [Chloroflexota bacterium]